MQFRLLFTFSVFLIAAIPPLQAESWIVEIGETVEGFFEPKITKKEDNSSKEIPEDEPKQISIDANNREQVLRFIEQEFIINKTKNLEVNLGSASKQKKTQIIKTFKFFLNYAFIYQLSGMDACKVELTPNGFSMKNHWHNCTLFQHACSGRYTYPTMTSSDIQTAKSVVEARRQAESFEAKRTAVKLLQEIVPEIIKEEKTQYDKALALYQWVLDLPKQEEETRKILAKCWEYGLRYELTLYGAMLEYAGIDNCIFKIRNFAWVFVHVDGSWMNIIPYIYNPDDLKNFDYYGLNNDETMAVMLHQAKLESNKNKNIIRQFFKYLPSCKNPDLSYSKKHYHSISDNAEFFNLITELPPNENGEIKIICTKQMATITFENICLRAQQHLNKNKSKHRIDSYIFDEIRQTGTIKYRTVKIKG